MYEEVKEMIKKNEGLRLSIYKDSLGKNTIGFGHLVKPGEKFTLLTKQQADDLFEQDFNIHLNHTKKYPNFNNLPKNVQFVLIDMTYNLGANWWTKWPKFNNAIKNNDFTQAALQIKNSRYYKQVGKRAERNMELLKKC